MHVPPLLIRRTGAVAAAFLAFAGAPAAACTVSPAVATDLGAYSPAAVKAGAVPALRSRAGLTCPSSLLTLLGGNYIRATFTSRNGLRLRQEGGAGSVAYTASADPNGTVPFAQGTTVDYMQNNLLNVLGLLGGSSADLPLFVKPAAAATAPPVGTYTDRITIGWSWYQCPGGVSALGVCVLGANSGSGTTVIDVTLTVTPREITMTLTTATTWDTINGTTNPRAMPGSRGRLSVAVANPDLVALDSGTLAVVLARPVGAAMALDGDGASTGSAIRLSEGATPSGVTVRYAGPADTTDDVDFSMDAGQSWAYVPVAGDLASEAAITHVRVRPQGAMARQSSFSVSIPYRVR